MPRTTIALTETMRDKLRALKTGGQTYEELLEQLIEQYEAPPQTR